MGFGDWRYFYPSLEEDTLEGPKYFTMLINFPKNIHKVLRKSHELKQNLMDNDHNSGN